MRFFRRSSRTNSKTRKKSNFDAFTFRKNVSYQIFGIRTPWKITDLNLITPKNYSKSLVFDMLPLPFRYHPVLLPWPSCFKMLITLHLPSSCRPPPIHPTVTVYSSTVTVPSYPAIQSTVTNKGTVTVGWTVGRRWVDGGWTVGGWS